MDAFARRKAAQAVRFGAAIPHASEVDRVLMLPRSNGSGTVDLAQHSLPGAQGITLRPVQEQALAEIATHGGLVGAIGVGHGKSLIALLSGLVLQVDRAIVLVAPATVPTMTELLEDLRCRYKMPPTEIVSWGKLSQSDAGDWLRNLDVDGKKVVLVADEAHFARNPTAARTKRLMAWLEAKPHVHFVVLSGTMTTRRLKDFAHLAHRALGDKAPVPRGSDLRVWDEILANEARSVADLASVVPLWKWATCTQGSTFHKSDSKLRNETHALLVRAFGERLQSAPGVVLTQDPSCQASLYIVQVLDGGEQIHRIQKQAEHLARTYRDPMGLEVADDAEIAKTAHRLSLGYFYRWDWPNGVADVLWMDRRSAWMRECRYILENHATWGFDSQALVEAAARREIEAGRPIRERWLQAYIEWREVEDRTPPNTVCEWVYNEPLLRLVEIAEDNAPAIIWYDEEAVADRLQTLGVEVLRAGQPVTGRARTLALSVRSHGAGLNLQAWSKQVFACVPANGTAWEQVLGRTHRQGQQEDEVWAWVPQWTGILRGALRQACGDARWIATSTGNKQKLLLATFVSS